MITKSCKECGLEKPFSDFPTYRLRSGTLAYRHSCRTCFNTTRPSLDPEKRKAKNLWYKYGLTMERYEKLSKNGCEVCGTFNNLVVDHDHSCCPGKNTCGECIRGILCDRHNRAEGMLRGNPEEAIALAEYMERTAN